MWLHFQRKCLFHFTATFLVWGCPGRPSVTKYYILTFGSHQGHENGCGHRSQLPTVQLGSRHPLVQKPSKAPLIIFFLVAQDSGSRNFMIALVFSLFSYPVFHGTASWFHLPHMLFVFSTLCAVFTEGRLHFTSVHEWTPPSSFEAKARILFV